MPLTYLCQSVRLYLEKIFIVMDQSLNNFYLSQEEPKQSCLLALRSIILKQDDKITESQKWGMPCFSYQNKMFSYLWIDKKTDEPYLLMVEGKHLHHPELEEGNRSRMKIFRVDPNADLPIIKIERLLNDALDLYRNGTIPIK